MSSSQNYSRAQFWKCALQVNPAGYIAYRGTDHGLPPEAYNRRLLDVALENGIKVIGLADHGNVDGVSAIRDIMTPHGIIVFPGFEICSTEKVHFVCLFAEDTTEQQLQRYLGALDLTNPADGVWPSNMSGNSILETIEKLGGFVYAAHCTDDSGLLRQKLLHVWKNPLLKACQIPGAMDDLKNGEGNSYRQILQNKNVEYSRERPIAVINAKDVAVPDDLANPKASCLIKMTAPCFESFRLAFQDPESRVRLNSEMEQKYFSGIEYLKVTGGYLDGLEIQFSNHLNAIIGGRGTGKSTLIECLRFALQMKPISKSGLRQHDEIIKSNLGQSRARVELRVRSSVMRGQQFTITRRYGENAMIRDERGQPSNFSPQDLLPGVEIYGQNEIYEIARDTQGQRQLLERFLGSGAKYDRQRIQEALAKLATNRSSLLESKRQLAAIEDELAKLPKLQERLAQFRNLGLEEQLRILPLLEAEKRLLERAVRGELTTLREAVAGVEECLPDTTFLSDTAIGGLPDVESFRGMRAELDSFRQKTLTFLDQWKREYEAVVSRLSVHAEWVSASVKDKEEKLENIFRELPASEGKTGRQIGGEYQTLLREVERLKPNEVAIATRRRVVDELQSQRVGLLEELSAMRSERTAALERSLKSLNRKLKGKLKLTVRPESERRPVIDFLLSCKLENVGEARLSWIHSAEPFSATRLAQLSRTGSEALRATNWSMTPSVADALAKLSFEQTLLLEEIELPDVVQIELNVSHGEDEILRPLEQLSTGQQCTAILHLLLLDNVDPLIVDQPEDNLDNAFIADRIVSELRSAKLSRQFLFSTHNANIPVFGDAEWIGVLQSENNQATMPPELQGAVDVPAVRDKAADILEGGKTAFNQRRLKYGYLN